MRAIYKYSLEIADEQVLMLRGDVLSAGVEGETIVVWAFQDDGVPERKVQINVYGTGHPYSEPLSTPPHRRFINTVFMGPFVWHIFATEVVE